jgi:hypothetical protein
MSKEPDKPDGPLKTFLVCFVSAFFGLLIYWLMHTTFRVNE